MPSYIKQRSRYDREAINRFNDMRRRMNRIMKEAQNEGFNTEGIRIEVSL